MAINQNHTAEELEGKKCAVVEKGVNSERADFLKNLLAYNGYEVVIAESAPPKKATSEEVESNIEDVPKTYTVGVTDVRYNTINAIFGRLLRTPRGRVVTRAYWLQETPEAHDDEPYFDLQKGQ